MKKVRYANVPAFEICVELVGRDPLEPRVTIELVVGDVTDKFHVTPGEARRIADGEEVSVPRQPGAFTLSLARVVCGRYNDQRKPALLLRCPDLGQTSTYFFDETLYSKLVDELANCA